MVDPSTSSNKCILVIEDDDSISMGLEMNLSAEGYEVRLAANGEDGLDLAKSSSFDLIILDVMLPKMNGFEVLRQLRHSKVFTPVMMLSARGAEMDKVMGLELGAEDYVTKPFGLAELLARVKAMLRRESRLRGAVLEEIRFTDVVIYPDAREVYRTGKLVELTATEFDVLLCLIEARGSVLSREQIQSAVWGENHHGTLRTIDNFLLQLRQKLEKEPQRPLHLVTVRGVGYRFILLWIQTCCARISPRSMRSPRRPGSFVFPWMAIRHRIQRGSLKSSHDSSLSSPLTTRGACCFLSV